MSEFVLKSLLFEQVNTADANTSHFVFISWADAATGGADFALAAESFPGEIDSLVVGHDEMRFFADPEKGVIEQIAVLLQAGDLFQEHLGVEDNTVADDAK